MVSKEEEANGLDVLAAGNSAARRWSLKILGNRRRSIFHQVMKDRSKAARLKVTEAEMAQIDAIPLSDRELIVGTWAVSDMLWSQYHKLVFKLVSNFAKRMGVLTDRRADLDSEGTVAFLMAMRGYDDRGFSFGAYMGMAVNSALKRYWNKQKGLSGSCKSEKLMIAYQDKLQALAIAGDPHSFDDVVAALDLTGVKREALWCALQHSSDGDSVETAAGKCVRSVDNDLLRAIGMVEMSVLERDAWITREEVRDLFPDARKSMRAVAEYHGVTPMAASYAATRANVKIVARLRRAGYGS